MTKIYPPPLCKTGLTQMSPLSEVELQRGFLTFCVVGVEYCSCTTIREQNITLVIGYKFIFNFAQRQAVFEQKFLNFSATLLS
jgi:hypothetical protein